MLVGVQMKRAGHWNKTYRAESASAQARVLSHAHKTVGLI